MPQHGQALPAGWEVLDVSKSIIDLYEDRAFVQDRIDEARREMKLIGHRNATNTDYHARERDIAGFYKSIASIDDQIKELVPGDPNHHG